MASTNSTQRRSTGLGGFSTVPTAGGSMNAQGATPSGVSNLFGALLGVYKPPKANPYRESGRMGTAVWGGYVENIEKDRRLYGQNRYKTASDILANISIVAAGLRFFLNLTSVPQWTVKPVEDLGKGQSSDQAKKLADFAQDIIDDLDTSWSRVIRRGGMYRFHGFGIQEWIAKRREDGLIGMADVESRPQHTIERWELADDGTIVGMWQRWPQNGQLLFLPRDKVIYTVDDTLSDSPEGLGLFRHLVEPAERLRRYLQLEGFGYERDLRGIPIGRAPLAEINALVEDGSLTKEQGAQMLAGIRKFIRMEAKEEDTAALLDSATYDSPNADGFDVSQVKKWDIDLLTASGTGFADIGKAIDRLTHDMARILGVESLLLGGQGGGSGSKALSEDKSRNLYLSVDSTVKDIAESMRRDFLGAVWKLNGLPIHLMPKLHTEDVAFKDVAAVAKALSDMAAAGAILPPDDPAINDVRDLLGISKQPDGSVAAALAAALLPRVQLPASGAVAPAPADGAEPQAGGGAQKTPAAPKPKAGPADRIDSDPSGHGPREPGPEPEPPGSPEGGKARRNRTHSSTIKGEGE